MTSNVGYDHVTVKATASGLSGVSTATKSTYVRNQSSTSRTIENASLTYNGITAMAATLLPMVSYSVYSVTSYTSGTVGSKVKETNRQTGIYYWLDSTYNFVMINNTTGSITLLENPSTAARTFVVKCTIEDNTSISYTITATIT
jgi:hypothetical protein